MWLLYQVALALVLAIAAPILLLRRGRHYLATLPGRLGRGPGEIPGDPDARPEGASVGPQAPTSGGGAPAQPFTRLARFRGKGGLEQPPLGEEIPREPNARLKGACAGPQAPTSGGGAPAGPRSCGEGGLEQPPLEKTGPLWLHAVSVGEVGVAATVAGALPATLPLLVTTITPTGQERARAAFARRARVAYLPFDLGFAVGRFFSRFEPRGLVLVEGDYWPLVLRAARRRGLPMAVVNGRVGDTSFRRMRRLRRWLGPLFGAIDRFGVQSPADRERLVALGVASERIRVTGNLKFESGEPPRHPELDAWIGRLAAGRALLVAGSTMAGEDEQVLAAFGAAGGGERALLVLAPRHPERWDQVAQLLAASGLTSWRRSEEGPGGSGELASGSRDESKDVLLFDSLGELAGLYSLATAAFVGGTLVPTGGHNPVEPARFGVPVAAGPSMENFRQIADEFDRAGAWGRAADGPALGALWRGWLDDPEARRRVGERAAALVEANRGALENTLELLQEVFGAALEGDGLAKRDDSETVASGGEAGAEGPA